MSSMAADFRPRKVCWIGLKASCSSYFFSNHALRRAVSSGEGAGCWAERLCPLNRATATAAATVNLAITGFYSPFDTRATQRLGVQSQRVHDDDAIEALTPD